MADLLRPLTGACADSMASRLSERVGSLSDALSVAPRRLRQLYDDAPQVAALLIAVRQTLVALLRDRAAGRPLLHNRKALLRYLNFGMARERHETARVLYLDSGGSLLEDETIMVGTIDRVLIDLRQILAVGMDVGAAGLVLVHNHPSGNTAPSAADLTLTRRLIAAARLLEMTVHDHLIVGRDQWFSLRQHGVFDDAVWEP